MSSAVKHTYTYSRKRVLHDSTTVHANKRVKLGLSDTEDDTLHAKKSRSVKSTRTLRTKHKSIVFNPQCTSTTTKAKAKSAVAITPTASKPKLTQLHLSIGPTSLRTCFLCDLSYTLGAPDDESVHRTHCARVQRGMEWGKDMDKDAQVMDIKPGILLKDGKTRGRIISVRGDIGGKVGSKMASLLSTVNLALSSPPLTRDILKSCKIYLFFLTSPSPTGGQKEKIAGCVVAQRISTARELVFPTRDETNLTTTATTGPLTLSPISLPTSLGIARLFVSSKSRRMGIANALLDSTAETFIHGCPLDPSNGDVAFTQPTGAGEEVMKAWGAGYVRIYEETDCAD